MFHVKQKQLMSCYVKYFPLPHTRVYNDFFQQEKSLFHVKQTLFLVIKCYRKLLTNKLAEESSQIFLILEFNLNFVLPFRRFHTHVSLQCLA